MKFLQALFLLLAATFAHAQSTECDSNDKTKVIVTDIIGDGWNGANLRLYFADGSQEDVGDGSFYEETYCYEYDLVAAKFTASGSWNNEIGVTISLAASVEYNTGYSDDIIWKKCDTVQKPLFNYSAASADDECVSGCPSDTYELAQIGCVQNCDPGYISSAGDACVETCSEGELLNIEATQCFTTCPSNTTQVGNDYCCPNDDYVDGVCTSAQTFTFQPVSRDALKSAVDACLGNDATGTTCCALRSGDVVAQLPCPYGTSHISNWDTSQVTDMKSMFKDASAFNADIGGWDTSQVTDMSSMFDRTESFNANIGNWDTSQVTTMKDMFAGAKAFDANIDNWDTSSVTNMYAMFYLAKEFDKDISCWNIKNVIDGRYFDSWSPLSSSCKSPFDRPENCNNTIHTEDGCVSLHGVEAAAFIASVPSDSSCIAQTEEQLAQIHAAECPESNIYFSTDAA